MSASSNNCSPAELAVHRLNDLLDEFAQKGDTQTKIATQAGLPPQVLSDVKHGRRPMTELIARRLGEDLHVSHEWLLGVGNTKERVSWSAQPASSARWLPLFTHPIEGEPKTNSDWDGTSVEVVGAAAAKLSLAVHPYVLKFGHNDIGGRLRSGDLALISQTSNADAEISVVRHRKKCFLARRNRDGSWSRVADGDRLPSTVAVLAHCAGLVWSKMA